jgi:5-methylcytosine-specific restriction protein A
LPRLKSLPPLLRREQPLLKRDDEQERNKRRYQEQPWRAFYNTREWQRLRLACFERDLYTCQRSGELCIPGGTGQEPNAPVANHKIPHRGDRSLFFDLDNLECITKAVHDSIVQGEEKRRR